MTDETTHLRALLAEQTARAERAESYAGKLKIDVSGFKGTISEQVDRIHTEMARAEKAEAERDAALAACAEMRVALEAVATANTRRLGESRRAIEAARAILSRPDLGAGMVVVPRESIDEWRDLIVDLVFDLGAHSRARKAVADLDALLEKAGG